MVRKLGLSILALLLSLFALGTVFAADSAPAKWDVAVGKQGDGVSIDSMFPKVIYINEGDTVTFTNGAGFAPHTVTFLAGSAPLSPQDPANLAPNSPDGVKWDGKKLLNTGVLEPGKSFTITFTASGAYPYYCILHPLMKGTVVVIPKGQPIPSVIEQAASAQAQLDDLQAQSDTLFKASQDYAVVKDKNGSLTYQIEAGAGHQGFTINRMMPETLYISEGDSVEWTNANHYEPHWVTFNKPANLSFFDDHGGFNPAFMPPTGGPVFDGTGFLNSGIIEAMKSYKLTFSKAGSYQYECYLHTGDKMVGTIVVAPKDSIKVLVNGKPLIYDYKLPHLHNNHVYAAIVPFAEALGGKAEWNAKLSAVVVNIGGPFALPTELKNTDGMKVIINGKQLIYGFEPGPHEHDGHSYASLQEMVSLLGGSYTWDEQTQTFSVHLGYAMGAGMGMDSHSH
ncbi:plastocyanin/azurin family copper-binding protein [Paenibacillus cremeus]|uniref:Plastocyanin n=1 Tax=Paenibacillus cremeus TaxID=2163881 RepID=A0A559K4M4_9BACL|nr:plastocyanin/azurin family copper-binding protein [Paenibacillus cremeus]TVY07091.1 hypothetical protein FPZ49_25815 [Paenibacillus cremeus]